MNTAAHAAAAPRVFISYARSDGEALARQLRERLLAHGVPLWRDREGMEGGRDWWQQITEAIDKVDFLVLVMTPAALQSAMVRREWRHARQRGVAVYPVHEGAALEFAALPRWMRSVHFYDLAHEWPKFVNDLHTTPAKVRVPFMVDDLPPSFVPRPAHYAQLRSLLLDPRHGEPVAITTALRGAGGFGKTVLARALCHDEAIQNAFDDGILWVTLGESPGDITGHVEDLIFMLSGQRPGFTGLDAATAALVELLADRDLLIVIDDVWDAAHVQPFLAGGPRCARIVTTRLSHVLPAAARRIEVDAMSVPEAQALLRCGLPPEMAAPHADALARLARRLGEWPLLLKLVNAALCERVLHQGQGLEAALVYVNTALDRRGLTHFDAHDAAARHGAVATTLGVSLAQLDERSRQRFAELAVFAEDAELPLELVARYWQRTGGLDEFDSEELCTRLARLSLVLSLDLTARALRLHDVVRAYLLMVVAPQLPSLHAALLDATRPAEGRWDHLATGEAYLWTRLFFHLAGSGRRDELRQWALDPRWLANKAVLRNAYAVEDDFAVALAAWPGDAELITLRKTFVQAAHLLAACDHPAQARATLVSRLDQRADLAEPHLHARTVLPDLPHPALLRTLGQHKGTMNACAISADGRVVATAGSDRSVRLWDAVLGQERHSLPGSGARALALSANGSLLAVAGTDRRLRLWDVASGEPRGVVAGHVDVITCCALSADGRIAVSGSLDGTLRVWDTATLQPLARLSRSWAMVEEGWMVTTADPGHWSAVQGCAISADGSRVASASSDQTLIVWELPSGRELKLLRGHEAGVEACAFSPCGRWLASAGNDHTVRVWDCDSGEHQVLVGHDKAVKACAFADGGMLLSASADGSVRVWDHATAQCVQTLSGHNDWVVGCAISAAGDLAVSVSLDGTARLWDPRVRAAARAASAHHGWVVGCAVDAGGGRLLTAASDQSLALWDAALCTPRTVWRAEQKELLACALSADGRLAATGSIDKTVAVWDVDTGQCVQTLAGHRDGINACCFAPDGTLLATVSNDRTLRLWDLATRSRKLAVAAHEHWINHCAISPDGRFVITVAADGGVRRWPLQLDDALWEGWIAGRRVLGAEAALALLKPAEFEGHTRSVNGCCFMPDGAGLLTASSDHSVRLWDVQTARCLRVLQGHQHEVNGCAASPDGRLVAAVASDGCIRIWRAADGAEWLSLRVDSHLAACAWVLGGQALVVVGAMGVYFFNVPTT